MSSTCTLPAASDAVIVTAFSAPIITLLSPEPKLVAKILNVLREVELCVVWNVRLPSPVLSRVCATAPSSMISGSLINVFTLMSTSPLPLSRCRRD